MERLEPTQEQPPLPRVRVLLATFNGAAHVREQVASVLDQRDVSVQLYVRDDGSTDDTVALLGGAWPRDDRVTVQAGAHLGAAHSYLTMLSRSPADVDYVALCDQDDVWLEGKLARATGRLRPIDGPAMYCSAVEVVDQDLRPLGVHRTCRRRPALENALVQNIATGCTIVLNRAALPLFRAVPHRPVMHDAWIYAVCAAVGEVCYDPATWVLYRQHQANAIGLASSPTRQWARRLRQHVESGSDKVHTRQAVELLEILDQWLSPQARTTITRFVDAQSSPARRLRYALAGPAFRQRRIDSLVYRALYALGRV